MKRIGQLSALALAGLAYLSPSIGWACTQCAVREGYDGASVAALGVMIMVPFGIAVMLWPILGRAGTAQGTLANESLTDQKIRSEWEGN